MPPGTVHVANTVTLFAVVGAGSYFLDPGLVSTDNAIALCSGILSGVFLSPDLDVDSGYIGLFYLRKIPIVGRIISLAWEWYWKPYSILVPHRHFISHFPVISTLIRYLYLSPVFFILHLFPNIWWVGGTVLSDLFHFTADFYSID